MKCNFKTTKQFRHFLERLHDFLYKSLAATYGLVLASDDGGARFKTTVMWTKFGCY